MPEADRSVRPRPLDTAPSGDAEANRPEGAVLLQAVLALPPNPAAWQALRQRVREQQGERADLFLATLLGRALGRLEEGERTDRVEALGFLIASDSLAPLTAALATDAEPAAQHLALAVMGRWPGPLDPGLFQPLRGLLLDRRLSAAGQCDALAALLRAVGPDSPLAMEFLRTLVSGLGKTRSIERLKQYEARQGKSPLVEKLRTQLEDRLRMSCPRCDTELRRPEMIQHLWNAHQLILEGRRVREPWGLMEDWIEAYRRKPDPELLERCRLLGQRLDPDNGPARVQRLLLRHGVDDAEAKRALLEEAAAHHAALCPWCFALVPVPREVPALRLNRYRGRLSAGGYAVEILETGARTRLEVRTPTALLYRGREPGLGWTPRGLRLVLATPLILLAVAFAFGLLDVGLTPLAPVLALLTLALLTLFVPRLSLRSRPALTTRAVRYAWTLLAPRLLEQGYSLADSAFLAGLARYDPGPAHSELRAPFLAGMARVTEMAVGAGTGPPGHLATLYRLLASDAVARGDDPVPLVLRPLARCFEGRLPLAFAEQLLAGWQASWWTPGNLARLRVLLCERAFDAGFEVRNLVDAGQNAPALGDVLGTVKPQGLAALRLVWSLRSSPAWGRLGEVLTVFDLAADEDRTRLLGQYPDLLLWQEEPDWEVVGDGGKGKMGPAQIFVTPEGVALQEVLFTSPPGDAEIRWKSLGYEMLLGSGRFRSQAEMEPLARRMERWFRYAFDELLPMIPRMATLRSQDRTAILRSWGAVPCPECRRDLVARVGQMGIALEGD